MMLRAGMVALDNTLPRAVAFTAPQALPGRKTTKPPFGACQKLFNTKKFGAAKGFEPSTRPWQGRGEQILRVMQQGIFPLVRA